MPQTRSRREVSKVGSSRTGRRYSYFKCQLNHQHQTHRSSHANEFTRSSTPSPKSATVLSKVSTSGSTTTSSKVSVSSGHNKPSQVNSEEEDLDASGGLSESEGGPDISDTNDKRGPIDAMEVAGHYVSSGGTVLHKLAPCPVSLSNLIKVLIINCDCPPQLAQTYATIIPTTLVPHLHTTH
jgi:hypothetical protein